MTRARAKEIALDTIGRWLIHAFTGIRDCQLFGTHTGRMHSREIIGQWRPVENAYAGQTVLSFVPPRGGGPNRNGDTFIACDLADVEPRVIRQFIPHNTIPIVKLDEEFMRGLRNELADYARKDAELCVQMALTAQSVLGRKDDT